MTRSNCFTIFIRYIVLLLLLSAGASLSLAQVQATPITEDGHRYCDIDGQKFRITILGEDEVTVLFESGMSDSIEIWGSIPDSVAAFARVFLYDRADIGRSDTSRQERTIPNMVSELRSILAQEEIPPPYVLVGHSLGGFITRYFSSSYPDEVIGLLLLDPGPETFWNNMSKRRLKKYIKGGNEWYHTRFEERYWQEWYQLIPNLKYMESLAIPANLPVILVTASTSDWFGVHEEIIAGFSNARHIELDGGHHIYKDHPELIVNYIYQLIETNHARPDNL